MRSLLPLLAVLFFSTLGTAQMNYEFFPYYNQELMDDLRITDTQVAQMRTLEKTIGERYTELNDALLYHEDYAAARKALETDRLKGIAEILTPEQKIYYEQFQSDIEAEQQQKRLQSYTEMYLNLYNYLGVSFEQAENVAKYDVGLYDDKYAAVSYKEGKEQVLKTVLSEEQWQTYSEKQQKEQFEVTTKGNGKMAYDQERLTALLEARIGLTKKYYVPQRAQVRAVFNEHISGTDQKTIAYLRDVYDELSREQLDELLTMTQNVQTPFNYAELWREHLQLQYASIFDGGRNMVGTLLRKDRETFNLAKELAIRYDAQIDAVQEEWEAIEQHFDKQMHAISMEHASVPAFKVIGSPNPEPQAAKNYQTEKVELERNLAFLLLGDQVEGTAAFSAKASKISAYPLPAATTQTLEFELPQAGETTIELVDASGKLLKIIYKGELNAGTQRQEVNLSEVPQNVFFYRITTSAGSTLLKSAKL